MRPGDELSGVIDDAYPLCSSCGERLVDGPGEDERPSLLCPVCGLGVIASS